MKKIFFYMLLSIVSLATHANAEWPERPIRLIVSFAPGGGSDTFSRYVQPVLEKELGVKVMINNVHGAAGVAGFTYVWKAPHDGYTWCTVSDATHASAVIHGNPITAKDWQHFVAGGGVEVIAVSKKSGISNLDEFMAAAQQPGEINLGVVSGGPGQRQAALLEKRYNLPIRSVTYNGIVDSVIACLAGEIQAVIFTTGELISYLDSGDLIPIAVTVGSDPLQFRDRKIPLLSSVLPKWADQNPPGAFQGFMIPQDVPEATKTRIKKAFLALLQSPEFAKFAEQQQWKLMSLTGKDAADFALRYESDAAYLLQELGLAKHSPESLGIKRGYSK